MNGIWVCVCVCLYPCLSFIICTLFRCFCCCLRCCCCCWRLMKSHHSWSSNSSRSSLRKWAKKSAHLLCKATALGAARRREDREGRVPRWLPGLRLLKLAASQFLPKSSGKKLMDCYLVVSLAHHPLLLPLPRPLCVQLKRGIFVSHIREGKEWGKRERGKHLCFVCS